jgi:hypothetical protein
MPDPITPPPPLPTRRPGAAGELFLPLRRPSGLILARRRPVKRTSRIARSWSACSPPVTIAFAGGRPESVQAQPAQMPNKHQPRQRRQQQQQQQWVIIFLRAGSAHRGEKFRLIGLDSSHSRLDFGRLASVRPGPDHSSISTESASGSRRAAARAHSDLICAELAPRRLAGPIWMPNGGGGSDGTHRESPIDLNGAPARLAAALLKGALLAGLHSVAPDGERFHNSLAGRQAAGLARRPITRRSHPRNCRSKLLDLFRPPRLCSLGGGDARSLQARKFIAAL